MSFSAGVLEVECPTCRRPFKIMVEAEAVRRHVIADGSEQGALTVLLGVNQVALDQELARHLDGCTPRAPLRG